MIGVRNIDDTGELNYTDETLLYKPGTSNPISSQDVAQSPPGKFETNGSRSGKKNVLHSADPRASKQKFAKRMNSEEPGDMSSNGALA